MLGSTLSRTPDEYRQDEWTRPVSAAEVHKADPREQLLVGWRPTGADRFAIDARWPAGHRFYAGPRGTRDPLLLIECVRQAIPMLCHAAYGVPQGFRQAWSDLRFVFEPAVLASRGVPADAELDVVCTDIVRRGTRIAGMTMSVQASLKGVPAARVQTRFSNQSPAIYERLRGAYTVEEAHARALAPGRPVPPPLVGRERAADVVLSPSPAPDRWYLRSDLNHPVLFDHPVDHVPGMLLLEAARQAALAASPQRSAVLGMRTVFKRYAEFDTPCVVVAGRAGAPAGPEGSRVTLVTVEQNGARIFAAEVSTAPLG
ncbi:hypothetical protein OG599_20380 [Streptomyces sp. NBC_01335]|uniref:ScbA/BarX family gamma-butyrolactone biosynthesis protein n=1 Tax=Streptomyces sp. NBC_01335 TaxID=2903828 RepID=UPI002E0E044C|nr:hypothetical protein OG599_20380 [Streptomyces sp. NBC_01335]